MIQRSIRLRVVKAPSEEEGVLQTRQPLGFEAVSTPQQGPTHNWTRIQGPFQQQQECTCEAVPSYKQFVFFLFSI